MKTVSVRLPSGNRVQRKMDHSDSDLAMAAADAAISEQETSEEAADRAKREARRARRKAAVADRAEDGPPTRAEFRALQRALADLAELVDRTDESS